MAPPCTSRAVSNASRSRRRMTVAAYHFPPLALGIFRLFRSAAAMGFVATTNPEGERKGAWTPELNTWFAGRKRVAIMEDNDAGAHMRSRWRKRCAA